MLPLLFPSQLTLSTSNIVTKYPERWQVRVWHHRWSHVNHRIAIYIGFLRLMRQHRKILQEALQKTLVAGRRWLLFVRVDTKILRF